MRVVSLSVGLPREVEWEGNTVLTSIFKTPVDRRLWVSTLNFEGDAVVTCQTEIRPSPTTMPLPESRTRSPSTVTRSRLGRLRRARFVPRSEPPDGHHQGRHQVLERRQVPSDDADAEGLIGQFLGVGV